MQKQQEKDLDRNSFAGSGKFLTTPNFGRDDRKPFLFAIFFLLVLSIGLLSSTIVLTIKLNDAYPSARVHYYIRNGDNANSSKKDYIAITVPDNATLFTVMEHASLRNADFKFEYTQYTFGKYISSIGGDHDNLKENLFWSVYLLPESPNPDVPPSQEYLALKGVDDIRIKDGDIILFWLRKSVIDHSKQIASNME